jgi:hypothetical protein
VERNIQNSNKTAADYTRTAAYALTTVVLSREQPPLG